MEILIGNQIAESPSRTRQGRSGWKPDSGSPIARLSGGRLDWEPNKKGLVGN